MRTKYITTTTKVDLDQSREVWSNGKAGDARVSVWATNDNRLVWAETNGDPVAAQDELRDCLLAEGLDAEIVERVIEGDLSGIGS